MILAKRSMFFVILWLCVCLDANAQIITTFAGTGGGGFSGDGGPAHLAQIPLPGCGAFDGIGNYYFFEAAGAPRIRKIDTAGIITTVAGNGTYGFSGDGGPATAAKIKNSFFDVDSSGNIFIADLNNSRLRKVDVSTGIINTIAGNGTPSSSGDGGPASLATLSPIDVCVDKYGNLFISDENGGVGVGSIRKISTDGIIHLLCTGSAGGMCLNSLGKLFIGANLWIIKIDTNTGARDTIAGTGIGYFNGDNIAADTANFKVYDLAIDNIGDLFIADITNNRIRKIDTFGIINTVAGTGIAGYSGDSGISDLAEINLPEGVAIDACGNIYIADESNNRIRKITIDSPLLSFPRISLSGIVSAPIGSSVTLTATVANAGSSYIIEWMNHGIEFSTTIIPTVTYTKSAGIDTITAKVVPTSYGCWDSTTSAPHVVSVMSEGIISFGINGAVSIYPNPATDELTISSSNKIAQVSITNVIGSPTPALPQGEGDGLTPALSKGEGDVRVNISGWPPGVYVVRVRDEQGNEVVRKVVKE